MTRSRFVATSVVLCIVLAACSSGGDESDASETTEGGSAAPAESQADPNGVVRLAYDMVAASRGAFVLEPAAGPSSTADLGLFHWIYGALLRPTAAGTLEPDLAEAAMVVDQNTIEIVMRDGVTLPDGTPLDAAAVQAGLERNLALTDSLAFRPGFFSLQSIEVTAPDTLRLTIPDGTAPSWYDTFLGGVETVIVPEGTDFSAPAGAGPFFVTEYAPSQRMVLERNPNYWDAERIQVAGIELVNVGADAQAGVGALSAGQVDWARIEFSLVDAAGSGLQVEVTPDPSRLYQFYVCKSAEPTDDMLVRQALNLAIDRAAINDAVFGGAGVTAWDLWPEGHRFHNASLDEHHAYDPAAAQALLTQAGYEDGFTIDVIPIQGGNVPEVVQIVQQQWAQIGVTLNIVASTNFVQDFFTDRRAQLGASPIASEQGRINGFTGSDLVNTCSYDDPALTDLAAQLRTVSGSSDEAVQLWGDFQQIVVDEALTIPILFGANTYAYDDDRLGGYELVPYTLAVPDLWQLSVNA